jgi:hypothetical protein
MIIAGLCQSECLGPCVAAMADERYQSGDGSHQALASPTLAGVVQIQQRGCYYVNCEAKNNIPEDGRSMHPLEVHLIEAGVRSGHLPVSWRLRDASTSSSPHFD